MRPQHGPLSVPFRVTNRVPRLRARSTLRKAPHLKGWMRRPRKRSVGAGPVLAVAVAMLATATSPEAAAQATGPAKRKLVWLAPDYSKGDLTGDQRVDQADLSVLTAGLGATKSSGTRWRRVAKDDFDGDGVITVSDLAGLSHEMIYNDGRFNVIEATVESAQAAMEAGKLTAVQLTQMYLNRIKAYDDAMVDNDPSTKLNSIITVNPHALQDAARLDAERKSQGPRSMLMGVPVIVKDNYNTFDMPTTVGCKCLETNQPSTDAFMIKQLRDAGAIILAKANLTEFASGYSGISSFKKSSNAWIPGGDSGGSSAGTGAAITANLGMVGLGTDTGGSIQVPGSYQGLADVYQSFGLVSREGIAPLALDQDRGGPLTRTLADSVILLDTYAKTDPNDSTTADSNKVREPSYAAFLDKSSLQGARIGYVSSAGTGDSNIGTNPGIQRTFNEAKATITAKGATLVDIGSVKMQTTSSGSTQEFGHDIDQWLKTYIPADSDLPHNADELKALLTAHPELSSISGQVIDRINRIPQYNDWMKGHAQEIANNQATINKIMDDNNLDAIIYPTTTRFGVAGGSGYSNVMIASLSGFPSVSVPAGYGDQSDVGGDMPQRAVGAPTTISFLGRMDSDGELIKLGYAFEQATHYRHAPSRFPDLNPSSPAPVVKGTPSFRVDAPQTKVHNGQTVTAKVLARNVPDAYSYTTTVRFDPAKVTPQVDKITSGVSGFTRVSVKGSTLTIVHTKLGSSPSAAGDFTLANVPFLARTSSGPGQITLKSVTIVGADSLNRQMYVSPKTRPTHPAKLR